MTRVTPIALLMVCGTLAIGRSGDHSSSPSLIWNATASAPEGLYRLQPHDVWRRGDLVAVRPPADLAAWLDHLGYAPTGVLLVKHVAALAPSTACRTGAAIWIDGAMVGQAKVRDRAGRALPAWSGCRALLSDEVFLLNAAEGSLDSRYFGPLPGQSILGRVMPMWLIEEHNHGG
jgi:type IV secretory pathway protease TraF